MVDTLKVRGSNLQAMVRDGKLLIQVNDLKKAVRETSNGKSQVVAEFDAGSFVSKDVLKNLGIPEGYWLSFRIGVPVAKGTPAEQWQAPEPEKGSSPTKSKPASRRRSTKARGK